MKTIKYIWIMCLAMTASVFTACSDDDAQSTPMTISKVYLETAGSSATHPSREVDFARLGQLLRIEGSGFSGLKKIYVNGYDTYFNNALMTDNNVWVALNSKTPVDKADPEVRNTIRFVKDNTETVYQFTIRAAAPSIASISNTLPQAGELVTVQGANLQEITQITLPGGLLLTSGIESDEDGEWFTFTMPAGVTEGGSIQAVGANGTAISPAYFNFTSCIILDFDGNGTQGYWSWSENGSMINDEDLVDDPLNSGRGKVCQLIPQRIIDAGGAVVKTRNSEVWTAGNGNDADDWTHWFNVIDPSTPLSELAFQFDIYVPQEWEGTGQIQVTAQNNISFNGYGSDETKSSTTKTTVWIPWLNDDGSTTPFKTDGWQTVTIPLSQFSKYANEIEDGQTPTFQEIADDRNAAEANSSYKNFGVGFVNSDIIYKGTEYPGSICSLLIYVDNFRIVPNKTITVSDFDDD